MSVRSKPSTGRHRRGSKGWSASAAGCSGALMPASVVWAAEPARARYRGREWSGRQSTRPGGQLGIVRPGRATQPLAHRWSGAGDNAYLAIDSYALVALVELCADDALVTAARTLLDKTLLTLATNSWRGIHGAARGRSYVRTLRSARVEEASPILRLVAGVGTLNDAVLPVTALALARPLRGARPRPSRGGHRAGGVAGPAGIPRPARLRA